MNRIADLRQKTMLFFGHKGTWAKVVFEAAKMETKFEEVKKTSPFADKVVIAVSYAIGTTFLYGDIYAFANANGGSDIVSSIVKNAIRSKGWVAHDSDDYLLTFDKLHIFGKGIDTGSVEVFWIGSRKPGAESPESTRRRR